MPCGIIANYNNVYLSCTFNSVHDVATIKRSHIVTFCSLPHITLSCFLSTINFIMYYVLRARLRKLLYSRRSIERLSKFTAN